MAGLQQSSAAECLLNYLMSSGVTLPVPQVNQAVIGSNPW